MWSSHLHTLLFSSFWLKPAAWCCCLFFPCGDVSGHRFLRSQVPTFSRELQRASESCNRRHWKANTKLQLFKHISELMQVLSKSKAKAKQKQSKSKSKVETKQKQSKSKAKAKQKQSKQSTLTLVNQQCSASYFLYLFAIQAKCDVLWILRRFLNSQKQSKSNCWHVFLMTFQLLLCVSFCLRQSVTPPLNNDLSSNAT